MSQVLNLKSKFLSSLNQTLQELTMKESITILKSPIMEADGNFTSVVQTVNKDFDRSKLDTSITVDDEDNKKAEEIKDKKRQLKDLVIDKIKQTLDVSDELQAVLNDLDKLNKEDHSKDWVVNKEDNTATLNDKNMRIFKQNEKLCLSHNGKVEIFDSVEELHDWLNKNNVKLPEGIAIHESAETLLTELKGWQNTPNLNYNSIGKWKDILQTPTGDTNTRIGQVMSKDETDAAIQQAEQKAQGEYLTRKKMNKAETNKYLDRHPEEDPTKANTVYDDITFNTKECTTTTNLGAPMQYTADKKLNEEELLDEISTTDLVRMARRTNKASTDNSSAQRLLKNAFNKENKSPILINLIKELPIYKDNTGFRNIFDQYLTGEKDNIDVRDYLHTLANGHDFTRDGNIILNTIQNAPDSEKRELQTAFRIDPETSPTVSEYEDLKNRVVNDSNPKFNLLLARKFIPGTKQGGQMEVIVNQSPEKLYNGILEVAKDAADAGLQINTSIFPDPKQYETGAEYWKAFSNRYNKDLREARFPLYLYVGMQTYLPKEKALELFPQYFGNNSNIDAPVATNDTKNTEKENYLLNKILTQLKTEEEEINNVLASDMKKRIERNGLLSTLKDEEDKDGFINYIISNTEIDPVVKKSVLLQALNQNMPLSLETLDSYAKNVGLDIGKASNFIQQADIDNILTSHFGKDGANKFISHIKNALKAEDEDDPFADIKTPEQKQMDLIKKLKQAKKAKNWEKGILTAAASKILQDPEIDTTSTQAEWEKLLGEARTFSEKMKVLKEALFKEDETPEDFSSGISSEMSAPTSDTSTDTSSAEDSNMNFDANNASNSTQPPSFGDINIDAGGFDPDEYGPDVEDDDAQGLPMPTEEFTIEDVLVNKEDKSDIKVKLKNIQTGEITTKDLSEIDI